MTRLKVIGIAIVLVVAGLAIYSVKPEDESETVRVVVTFEPASRTKPVVVVLYINMVSQGHPTPVNQSPYSVFVKVPLGAVLIVDANQPTAGTVTCSIHGRHKSTPRSTNIVGDPAICRYPGL